MANSTETTPSRKSRAPRRQSQSPESRAAVTTYSIRLTEPERLLLEKALKTTGWTATHFITRATLERAAHVENVRGVTSFDFDDLARSLAKQLCKPGCDVLHEGPADVRERLDEFLDRTGLADSWETDPPPLTNKAVEHLRQALRLGGSEFLKKVVDECDLLVPRDRPEPIDPEQVGQEKTKE